MRVSLFVTCVNDTVFPDAGRATVTLLERLGHTVDFPVAQTCCGQMHLNSGFPDDARALARKFVADFADAERIVTPSGSCATVLRKHYPELAEGDPALAREVARLTPRVYELTEFLVDVLGRTDVGAYFPHKVAYHPSCHSKRMLLLGDRPEQLLKAVRGLEYVELLDAQECCGFGGTFSVKNRAVSASMAATKARNAVASGAEFLCGADNSCLLNIGGTLHKQGAPVRTLHIAEILAATEGEAR
ncbi:(Fe-S)-binding protein [Streptomyces sp. AV19]|uniref:(Fe-S)-binding protein n=1 Tax=Streptomyces sp. AV19 TaxID=2793068 RepID=UPI0018FE8865|nr:(Fe-S)-binding protein [Streptomyces sp. AV19]MBH1937945.1 (Fe-S)-binding protein [Streptomyces sp. AV19]MDG4536884.1 (Fe-S)-binding protein [Streptomyces sp. AV19]